MSGSAATRLEPNSRALLSVVGGGVLVTLGGQFARSENWTAAVPLLAVGFVVMIWAAAQVPHARRVPRWVGPLFVVIYVFSTVVTMDSISVFLAVAVPTVLWTCVLLFVLGAIGTLPHAVLAISAVTLGFGVIMFSYGTAELLTGQISRGVTMLCYGIAALGYGVAMLLDRISAFGIGALGLGVVAIVNGTALLLEGQNEFGIATVGLGVAALCFGAGTMLDWQIGVGISALGGGAMAIGLGMAILSSQTGRGIAMLGLGAAALALGVVAAQESHRTAGLVMFFLGAAGIIAGCAALTGAYVGVGIVALSTGIALLAAGTGVFVRTHRAITAKSR